MDNLTHSLVAVLISRSGLNRLAPSTGWLAVAAANLPDADIASWANGTACYLEYHRGWTHALFWGLLVALLPLPLWRWVNRRRALNLRHWLGAYAVTLAAVLSHHLLDFLNVYGTRILLPFSSRWYRLDLVHIIDVWVWAILLIAVLGPMLARLVYSEIGARGGSGRVAAWVGLIALAGYVWGRAQLHSQALAAIESRLYQREAPGRVAALPSPVNPWQWTGLVETSHGWHVVPVDLFREYDPEAGSVFHQPDISREREIIRRTGTGGVFLDFSQFPLWRVVPVSQPEGGSRVSIYDLRFGTPEAGTFEAQFLLDAAGRVTRESFEFGNISRRKP